MNKKLSRILEPGMRLSFLVLTLFVVAAAAFGSYYLAVAEGVVLLALFFYCRHQIIKNRDELLDYIAAAASDVTAASKNAYLNLPIATAMIRPGSEEIVWSNDLFTEMAGTREHLFEIRVGDVIPGFSTRWLMEGKNECPEEVVVGDRRYRVFGSLLRGGDDRLSLLATTYWVDQTELLDARDELQLSRPVAALILIDNYDELTKNLTDTGKSTILAAVDQHVTAWAENTGGILRKIERDRYLFVFESRFLPSLVEAKFPVLEAVHAVMSPAGVAATISIGFGKDGNTMRECFSYAALSIEMALSRGGDQAVVKDRFNFSFYGGRARETERRTKVKSRVMANSLSELIGQSSNVFVMGHKFADIDSVGAAAGVMCLCRKKDVKCSVVIDVENNAAKALVERLSALPEYEGAFVGYQEAILMADSRSLLVVVDTNRPDQVESQELLLSCTRVAIIDHHRRAADFIENAALSFHEPFASSACELVTELLQYTVEQQDILRAESEALLAGIVLDTKNFGVRTGGRTFDAAAYLRRAGADTVDVKKLFQNDLDDTVARYQIIKAARLYRQVIAIAALDKTCDRTIAAQAADELLNISGILTSFVLYPDGDRVVCSARSIGDANVQMILEPLGGGGNAATAGAQIKGMSVEETLTKLVASIDSFYDEE